jgi:hypothetical protein
MSQFRIGSDNGQNRYLLDAYNVDAIGFMPVSFSVYEVRYSDFSAVAATAGNLALDSTKGGVDYPATSMIAMHVPIVYVETPFTGGSISAITAEIGDAADTDELMAAVSVFSGTGYKAAVAGAKFGTVDRYEAAYAPIVRLAATGGNLSTLTAGKLRIVLPFIALPATGLRSRRT